MCKGQLIVGLGVGWNAEEHRASGTDVETRGRRMDDFIPALLACWGEDPVSYDGPIFQIPSSLINPKPRRRPTLLSGMWSKAGLERTARWFDAWNPAGMPVGKVAKMAASINALRDKDQEPIAIYYRSFAQAPLGPLAEDGSNVQNMVREAEQARDAGFAEITLEHNFWSQITKPDDWLKIPELYVPVLNAARS
jgi:hypothetical protein